MNRTASTWSHSARGLEILTPRPGQIRLLLAIALTVLVLLAGWIALVSGVREVLTTLAFFVDGTVLALLLPALAVLLWFDRHSAMWVVFGGDALVQEQRVGRWVVSRSMYPLSGVARIDSRPEGSGGTWGVGWHPARGDPLARPLASGLDEAQARALASRLTAWIGAPQPTAAVREGGLAVEWPRVVARLLSTRIASALPLAVAAGAALALAATWQLRDAKYADALPYDAIADGELLALQWVLRAPDAADLARGQVQANGDLRLGVRYTAADGVARSLWWHSAEHLPLDSLPALRFDPVARLIGLPVLELVVPVEAAALMTPRGGSPSFAHWPIEVPPGAEAAHAWLDDFDRPLELLAARGDAATPDWRVTYRRDAPAQATLLRLAEIGAEGARGIPWPLLLAIGSVATALMAWGLEFVLPRGRTTWLVVGALVLSLPAWAPYGQRIGAGFGIDRSFDDGLRQLALAVGSERTGESQYQFTPVPGDPPAAEGVVVRWTLGESGAAPFAALLGLEEPLPPGSSFEQRRSVLESRAAERIAALDDAALVDLIQRWEPEEFGRLANLRVAFVDGVCGAWRQADRSEDTRRWLEWSLSNPAICDP